MIATKRVLCVDVMALGQVSRSRFFVSAHAAFALRLRGAAPPDCAVFHADSGPTRIKPDHCDPAFP
jgi:hypothetical protein